jgi:hypothetical protein
VIKVQIWPIDYGDCAIGENNEWTINYVKGEPIDGVGVVVLTIARR